MRTKSFLLALSALASSVTAFGQNATVTTKASPGLLQLAGSGIDGQILVSANDWWGIIRAAQDLANDFGKVTGTNLTLGNWHGGIIPGNYSRHNEERPARRGPQWVVGVVGMGPLTRQMEVKRRHRVRSIIRQQACPPRARRQCPTRKILRQIISI